MNFSLNDGGREAAGLEPTHGACAVRAIAIATGIPYQTVWDSLYAICKEQDPNHSGTAVDELALNAYMKTLGWQWQELDQQLTLEQLPKEGVYVVMIPGHLAALVNGYWTDTQDTSQDGRARPYGYFFKK